MKTKDGVMAMSRRLPISVVEKGLALAEGSTLFGVLITELTRDELVAMTAMGWHREAETQKKYADTAHARMLEFFDSARKRRGWL